jgi:hypothetical protein
MQKKAFRVTKLQHGKLNIVMLPGLRNYIYRVWPFVSEIDAVASG